MQIKLRRQRFTLLTLLLFGLLSVSCNWPDKEYAKTKFLERNPDCSIISVSVIEGDSSAVYYQIKFQKPDSNEIFTENWAFVYRKETENWELVGIEQDE